MLVNRLSALLGERRMSIQDLARQTGLAYSTCFDFYHDRMRRFDRGTLERICRALGVGLCDLLRLDPDEPQR